MTMQFHVHRKVLLTALLGGFLLIGCGGEGTASDESREVRVILDFLPNPMHVGLYFAEERDLFAANDLDLQIDAPTSTSDTLRLMAAGRADFGFVSLYDFLQARNRGIPITIVAAIVQEPLAAVIAPEATGIGRPADLAGRLVGITGVPSDEFGLRSMVRHDGGDPDAVETVNIGFNVVQNLLGRNVDAAFGFWSYEGVQFAQRQPARIFRLADFGAPRYPEVIVFARDDFLAADEPLTRDFLRVLQAGYATSVAEPEAALIALAGAIEGDTVEGLQPYLDALLPAFQAEGRAVLEIDLEALEAYHAWLAGAGLIEDSSRNEPAATNRFLPATP